MLSYWYVNISDTLCTRLEPSSLLVHSSPKETQVESSYFSRWSWVTDPDPVSCQFCQMVLGVACKRPHSKIPDASFTILRYLRTSHFSEITKQLKSHCNQSNWSRSVKYCVAFWNDCMPVEHGVIFYFGNVPVNIMQNTPFKNIKRF